MVWNNFIESIYNMAIGLIDAIGYVWNWLIQPIEIDVPLLSDIPVIGGWFNIALEYSPIELIGVGIALLLVLWVIKSLIPLG
jgi:hypothetical protein